jgi:hypothetical protein
MCASECVCAADADERRACTDSEYNADDVDDGASVNDSATREGEEELSTAMADGLMYDWDCAMRLWTRSMLTWRILQSMMCVPMKQAKKHST